MYIYNRSERYYKYVKVLKSIVKHQVRLRVIPTFPPDDRRASNGEKRSRSNQGKVKGSARLRFSLFTRHLGFSIAQRPSGGKIGTICSVAPSIQLKCADTQKAPCQLAKPG